MTNEEAVNVLRIMASGIELKGYSDHWVLNFREAYEMAFKSLENERPHGEWLEVKEEVHFDYWTVCECSLCKHSWALGELSIEDIKDDYKFCPNCGADMRSDHQTMQ